MIINIRGTSGSGKTTIVNTIMDMYSTCVPIFMPGRARPVYYKLWHKTATDIPNLVVIGSYSSTCGGCDNIPNLQLMFDLIIEAHGISQNVIFEGLLVSSDVNRTLELCNTLGQQNCIVIALNTTLEDCIKSINTRRWKRDCTLPPVNPSHTESKYRAVLSSLSRLRIGGMTNVLSLNREEAFTTISNLLFKDV